MHSMQWHTYTYGVVWLQPTVSLFHKFVSVLRFLHKLILIVCLLQSMCVVYSCWDPLINSLTDWELKNNVNNVRWFVWDIVTYPCPNSTASLTKTPLKVMDE